MRPVLGWMLLLGLALTPGLNASAADTREVVVKDLKLKVPVAWEKKETSSPFRLAQFSVPAAEGSGAAELVVSFLNGEGGGLDANLKRWEKQFDTDGRDAKYTSGKSDLGDYHLAVISGTYNQPVGPPIQGRTKSVPDSQTMSLVLPAGDGTYYVRLTGPKATVAAQADAFRQMIGAKAEAEKTYELK